MKLINAIFLGLICSVILFSCKNEEQTAPEKIVILFSTDADLPNEASAVLLEYFEKIPSVEVIADTSTESKARTIKIGRDLMPDQWKDSLNNLHEDGFLIGVEAGDVFIAGNNPQADIYGACTFLEAYLGIIKLTKSEDYIPEDISLRFENGWKKYEPAFDFRRTLLPGQYDQGYRNWYKIEELDDWGMFVHTFQHLISPEDYFDEHPEYFSLISGRRLKDAQLCLSNPGVIRLLIENLGKEMAKKPEKKYWSVSQNDAINYCECDNCFALYEKYETISGAYIQMANEIATAYPDKHISTLAYQYTRSAPKNIKPLPNVNIMFCSIECNRSMPLTEDERSAGFTSEMRDWSALTDNIFVWDYVVQFKNYLTPFPNFHVLQPNIQFFKENNVNMMFQQGSGGNWSDMSELKQYLISKLLWDPEVDVEALTDKFLTAYYGPAAKHIKAYFDLYHKELKKHAKTEFLDIYGFPLNYADSYLTPELLEKYKSFMDKAEAAVKNDEQLLGRVQRARMPVDFAYIDIAMNGGFESLSLLEETNDGKAARPEIMVMLNNLVEYSQRQSNIKVNERNFTVPAYKNYVLGKIQRMTSPNLLEGATLKLNTTHSETYPVGGAKALNDGLLGDLDFHNNWLGFQGYDMELDVDFGAEKDFSRVSVNFLKAVNSWVFLPVNVMVEVSEDGENYELVAQLPGDTEDQNYLVKSIPFEFEFEKHTARYLRITAESLKTCPDWHRGFGKPSWIFVDEVVVME